MEYGSNETVRLILVNFRRENSKYFFLGKMWTIKANKEVILSAGSLNSAQLLMLSGIGPKWHLDQLGIPTIADLPVGENLQDHYGTGALAFTVDKPVTLVQSRYENIPSVLKYAMFGSGPLTVLGGVEGLAWIPTKYENRSKVRKIYLQGVSTSSGYQNHKSRKIREVSDLPSI